ncbi:MAG: hypothetical protein ACRCS0_06085, partial [Albidovulum sp.]
MDARSPLQEAIQRSIDMEAPLATRLAAYAKVSAQYAPEFVAPIEALVARLRATGAGASAPAPGDRMPGFSLPDAAGTFHSLHPLLAAGPVALVFDRGHWCSYCRINTAALSRA